MVDLLFIKGMVTLLVVFFGFALSSWVLLSDKKSTIHRTLFVLINLILLYISADYISGLTGSSLTTFLMRMAHLFGMLALGCFYYFSLIFPFAKKSSKPVNIFMSVVVAIFAFLAATTDLVVSSTHAVDWGVMINGGPLLLLYYAILMALLIFGFLNIIIKYSTSTKIEKKKIKLLLIGMIIFAFAQIVFTIVLPLLGVGQYYYLGDYSVIIFIIMTAYAIVKHHLFDVKLAVMRSVTYSLVLISLACLYFVITLALSAIFDKEIAGSSQMASGVFTSLMLAFAFQPLKRFFDKVTNKVFFKDSYNTDDFFARLNNILALTTNLRNLLEKAAYEIGNTLKSEQAFFFINTFDGHYVSSGTPHHKYLPKNDADLIEKSYGDSRSVIVASMLEDKDPVRRLMLSHRIEIILPLVQAGKFIGHLCLGDNLTSGYSNRDMRVLDTISDELAIAIQNSLSVQEIRDINATLQQRIENATKELRSSNVILRHLDKAKDEFVSMASHQLRTPLTSVKGYISMVLEGDAGEITEAQRHFLDEAFMSSERMVHLINDFLNVSRIQTGKFIIDKHSVDLSKVIKQEIDSLQPSAIARNLMFVYHQPKNFPMLSVDESKIRQVIMNFADNALYYSHENTKIIVSLLVEGNEIVFTVKDLGIGVPHDEREQLFSKFYRASNARKQRPDGTGVGLYLAKKIIDAHDGKIIFDSVEGKGSTFGFRLPINR